jgi:hypothetical protein
VKLVIDHSNGVKSGPNVGMKLSIVQKLVENIDLKKLFKKQNQSFFEKVFHSQILKKAESLPVFRF